MKMEFSLIKKMEKNWFLIISLCFIGCFNNAKNQHKNLISKESFRNILIDVERNIKLKPSTIDTTNNINQDSLLLDNILREHQYSYDMYEQTLLFYIDKPEEMIQILNTVKDSLTF